MRTHAIERATNARNIGDTGVSDQTGPAGIGSAASRRPDTASHLPASSQAPTVPHSVCLHALEHRFGARKVFSPVEAEIRSGQVAVVTGANGSGKSTLLRILAGLLPPTAGAVTVTVEGENQDRQARRRFLGYVAPDLTLYRELTGAENLAFFAQLRGMVMDREDLIARLAEVGLKGRGRDLVSAYSSGMRQRLKYAFALLARPPILLLDEPTANLDSEGIAMVQRLIAAQRERPGGGLAILATNEPRELDWGEIHIPLDTGR